MSEKICSCCGGYQEDPSVDTHSCQEEAVKEISKELEKVEVLNPYTNRTIEKAQKKASSYRERCEQREIESIKEKEEAVTWGVLTCVTICVPLLYFAFLSLLEFLK